MSCILRVVRNFLGIQKAKTYSEIVNYMVEITVLFASSKDDSLIAKPKLEELPLIFMRFFENSSTVDTHQKI